MVERNKGERRQAMAAGAGCVGPAQRAAARSASHINLPSLTGGVCGGAAAAGRRQSSGQGAGPFAARPELWLM